MAFKPISAPFDFTTIDVDRLNSFGTHSLSTLLSDKMLAKQVVHIESQRYASVNIAQTMQAFTKAAKMLKRVFAKSKAFNCHPEIKSLWTQHRFLTLGYCTSMLIFQMTALEAFKAHVTAHKFAEEKLDMLEEQLESSTGFANSMSTIAAKSATSIGELTNLSSAAVAAVNDCSKALQQEKAAHGQNGELEKSILMLRAITESLNLVRAPYEQVRLFWESVQNHCDDLADTGNLEQCIGDKQIDNLLQEIETTAISWLALAHINHAGLQDRR